MLLSLKKISNGKKKKKLKIKQTTTKQKQQQHIIAPALEHRWRCYHSILEMFSR